MSKVSVIVPVYNVEKYIGRCIKSIQKQTLTDWELILVDDCSPDNSFDIISEYAKKDSRIIVKRHDVNHGPMIARRWGDEISRGEFITYCDGDDTLPDNALELLYNTAIETGADIVSGNMTYITISGSKKVLQSTLRYGNDKISAFRSLLRGELCHNLCSKLFKASILKDYTYRSYEHFTNGEDGYVFYLAVSHIKKIVQIDDSVYFYMQNTQSSSQVRYGNSAIYGICIINRIRHEVTSAFRELDIDRHRCITLILYGLYSQGYAFSTNLKLYIEKQGLRDYLSLRGKYFSKVEILKLWVKRYLMAPFMFIETK